MRFVQFLAQDYDFIAVRLQPSASVKDMKPLRVVIPGPITTFPLRMLSPYRWLGEDEVEACRRILRERFPDCA